jgi:hypothetical protein
MQHETITHDSGTKKPPIEPKAEATKTVFANESEPVVRFKIDGLVKSLNKPVRGSDLYRVAGEPKSLKLGGKEIANDSEPVEIDDDAELKITR